MSNLQSQSGMTLPEKVLQQIQLSDQALEKAAAVEAEQESLREKIAAKIPSVVQALVENGRVNANEREKLASALTDPLQTLNLLENLAAHRNKEEISRIGTGVAPTTKAASAGSSWNPANSLVDPNVGARTTRVKQSSVNLFERLGLAAPTEG